MPNQLVLPSRRCKVIMFGFARSTCIKLWCLDTVQDAVHRLQVTCTFLQAASKVEFI